MTLPARPLSADDALRHAAQREGAKKLQDLVKESLGTPKALTKAMSGGWTRRCDAITMLGYLGHDAEVLRLALDETDAQAIVDHALKFLPAPVELVVHALMMKRGDASARMLYTIPCANYLYAEHAIVPIVAKSPARLSAPLLEAFGLAGLRSTVPILRKHVRLETPRNYADAITAGQVQDKPSQASHAAEDTYARLWDGSTQRAFAAVAALRRLGEPIDVDAVTAWRGCLAAAMPTPNASYAGLANALLSWALFDAGVDRCFEEWLALEFLQRETLHDMAATLLKRGDGARMARLLPLLKDQEAGASRAFCHWPVADWCQSRGLVPAPGQTLSEMYCLSRDADIAPPSWWQWQSDWQPGFFRARLRGML